MKVIQFKVYDEKLEKFITSQPSISEFLINLVDDFRNGKLVPLENKELDKKIKEKKLEIMHADLLLKQFEIKLQAIRSGHSPSEAIQVLKEEIPIIDTNQVSKTLMGQDSIKKFQSWTHFCHPVGKKVELRYQVEKCSLCQMTQYAEDVQFV